MQEQEEEEEERERERKEVSFFQRYYKFSECSCFSNGKEVKLCKNRKRKKKR